MKKHMCITTAIFVTTYFVANATPARQSSVVNLAGQSDDSRSGSILNSGYSRSGSILNSALPEERSVMERQLIGTAGRTSMERQLAGALVVRVNNNNVSQSSDNSLGAQRVRSVMVIYLYNLSYPRMHRLSN